MVFQDRGRQTSRTINGALVSSTIISNFISIKLSTCIILKGKLTPMLYSYTRYKKLRYMVNTEVNSSRAHPSGELVGHFSIVRPRGRHKPTPGYLTAFRFYVIAPSLPFNNKFTSKNNKFVTIYLSKEGKMRW